MHRPVAILGAPSSIGIRPDDQSGQPQSVDRAPGVLRELGLVARLDALDLGDVVPPPYQDFTRPPGRARNEAGVATYSRSLADRVATGIDDGRFVVVLGGDCSIVLGCLLGAGRRAGQVGLAYVDAHADFATPEESQTGSVASMCLALAVGHGDSPLARLAGPTPIVRARGCRADRAARREPAELRSRGAQRVRHPRPARSRHRAGRRRRYGVCGSGACRFERGERVLDPGGRRRARSRGDAGGRFARTGRAGDRRAGGAPRPAGGSPKGARNGADALRPVARPGPTRARRGWRPCSQRSSREAVEPHRLLSGGRYSIGSRAPRLPAAPHQLVDPLAQPIDVLRVVVAAGLADPPDGLAVGLIDVLPRLEHPRPAGVRLDPGHLPGLVAHRGEERRR